MAYLNEDQIYEAYQESTKEADIWRIDYPEYERLADNGLMEALDENLPEVNDGSLAASLFKLAKRVIRKKLGGRAFVQDRDEDYMTEMANIEYRYIMRHANSKASPRRKGKDAVRKAAIYGGQPIINLQVERGNYRGQDFIVPYAQDVKLEAGKDSDEDSDIIFWDIYLSDLAVQNMLEQAKEEIADGIATAAINEDPDNDGDNDSMDPAEMAEAAFDEEDAPAKTKKSATLADATSEAKTDNNDEFESEVEDAYNIWDVDLLEEIANGTDKSERAGNEMSRDEQQKGVKKSGHHFYIAWQRGVNAPFKLMYKRRAVQAWSNPDPTGDVPCHYLYCYQDFVNPYGVGIVKLAGGTQNVLDYMRQAHILATQLGLRPPKQIQGDEDQVDEDSLVYAQDANWYVGQAKVERMEMANGVYSQLPNSMGMYKVSLNQFLPTGDTSIAAGSGDPQTSRTPAGVNFQAGQLSIDDEDFAENWDETWAAVSRSMINNQFANMQGDDWRRITDEQKADLIAAGAPQELFEMGADGKFKGKVKYAWDEMRAAFDFEVDSTTGFELTSQEEIQILKDTIASMTPQQNYYLGLAGWKFDLGEATYSLLSKMNLDNLPKMLTRMSDEEWQQAKQAPFPIIDPPQIRLTGQVPTAAMPYALQQGGVNLPPNTPLEQENVDWADILKDPNTTPGEKAQIKALAGLQPDPSELNNPSQATIEAQAANAPAAPDTRGQITPELQLKAQQQDHQQNIDLQRLELDKQKLELEAHKAANPVDPKAAMAEQAGQRGSQEAQQPNQISPEQAAQHISQVQELYGVDAHTAAAALEAERQGADPQKIIEELKRQGAQPAGVK